MPPSYPPSCFMSPICPINIDQKFDVFLRRPSHVSLSSIIFPFSLSLFRPKTARTCFCSPTPNPKISLTAYNIFFSHIPPVTHKFLFSPPSKQSLPPFSPSPFPLPPRPSISNLSAPRRTTLPPPPSPENPLTPSQHAPKPNHSPDAPQPRSRTSSSDARTDKSAAQNKSKVYVSQLRFMGCVDAWI